MAKKVPTFKLELTGNEAGALAQILKQINISGESAEVVASIQRKMRRAAGVFNKATKDAPEPRTKRPKRKSNPGNRGKR